MYTLAGCADTLYLDDPFEDRVRKIANAGLVVEFWGWENRDLEGLAKLRVTYGTMSGHLHGSLVDPGEADEYLDGVRASIDAAKVIGCSTLVLHSAEIGPDGRAVNGRIDRSGSMWMSAYATLSRVAELAERSGVIFLLENLNTTVDHPGTPLAQPSDVIDMVQAVGSPRLKVLLDLYHAQIDGGNLTALIERALPRLGEVQVADVPGRHEPGTGEINYEHISEVLRQRGFDGAVCLEAFPLTSSEVAINRFMHAFPR